MFVPLGRSARGRWAVLLWAAGLVAAARGGEQYGGGVPQYGAEYERAEYHAPDAPPALDYNFEDQERHEEANRRPGYAPEPEPWDLRESTRETSLSSDEPEEVVKAVRVGRRRRRGRRDDVRPEPPPRRRPPPRDTARRPHDDYGEQEYGGTRLEAEPAGRVARKPRERLYAPPPLARSTTERSTQLAAEEEEGGFRRATELAESEREEAEYYSGAERAHEPPREPPRRPTLPPPPPAPPATASTAPPAGSTMWSAPTLAAYPEYNEYYGHKRYNNKIKPNLIRRSSTAAGAPSPRLRFQTREEQPVRPAWGGRRAGEPPAPAPPAPAPTASAATTYSPVAFVPETNASEPSLAERSRLSILRKAQQKERAGGGGTSKPPVLLRVTSRPPTVVMVQAGDAWQRARHVSGDSPETLAKVKRLMRQKLVAGAKNIRDLTDNWDDTVCDYIDVAMLQQTDAATPLAPLAPSLLVALAFYYCCL